MTDDELTKRAHLINELDRVDKNVKPHEKATVHATAYRQFPQFKKSNASDLTSTETRGRSTNKVSP